MKDDLKEVLFDGLDYMKRVQKNLPILTDAIKSGDISAVNQNYGHLKEGMEWINDALGNFEHFLELDYSQILICKQGSDKIIAQYKNLMGELDDLYSSGDFGELARKVETDLPKHFKKIASVFNKVNEIIKEDTH